MNSMCLEPEEYDLYQQSNPNSFAHAYYIPEEMEFALDDVPLPGDEDVMELGGANFASNSALGSNETMRMEEDADMFGDDEYESIFMEFVSESGEEVDASGCVFKKMDVESVGAEDDGDGDMDTSGG